MRKCVERYSTPNAQANELLSPARRCRGSGQRSSAGAEAGAASSASVATSSPRLRRSLARTCWSCDTTRSGVVRRLYPDLRGPVRERAGWTLFPRRGSGVLESARSARSSAGGRSTTSGTCWTACAPTWISAATSPATIGSKGYHDVAVRARAVSGRVSRA